MILMQDIILKNGPEPSPPPVVMNGDRSLYVHNQGEVNVYLKRSFQPTAANQKKLRSLSSRYYQLIVTECDIMHCETIYVCQIRARRIHKNLWNIVREVQFSSG